MEIYIFKEMIEFLFYRQIIENIILERNRVALKNCTADWKPAVMFNRGVVIPYDFK